MLAVERLDVACDVPLEVDLARLRAGWRAASATAAGDERDECDRTAARHGHCDRDAGSRAGRVGGGDGEDVLGLVGEIEDGTDRNPDLRGVQLDLEQRTAPGELVAELIAPDVRGGSGRTYVRARRCVLRDAAKDVGQCEHGRIVDRADSDGGGRDIGKRLAVGNMVGEGVGAVRVAVGLVGNAVVARHRRGTPGGAADDQNRERVVLGVAVVAKHADRQRRVLLRRHRVIARHGWVVHGDDGDGDRRRVGEAGRVAGGEGDGVRVPEGEGGAGSDSYLASRVVHREQA